MISDGESYENIKVWNYLRKNRWKMCKDKWKIDGIV